MTHAVEIPALDGRSPLGFLAALGLLVILGAASSEPMRLSFSETSAAAVIHSRLASLGDVVDELDGITAGAAEAAAIVGLDPRFPLRAGIHADPMRRPREDYRDLDAAIRRFGRVRLTPPSKARPRCPARQRRRR
ncbi:MAG: hypothetical protein ABSB01_01785 [Streptosporangiaceae bacterium]|jgi:hypothetical protein